MAKKQRIDQLLVKRGLYQSRERAKRAVMAGYVEVEGLQNLKPGHLVAEDTTFIIKEKEKFVSRGGYKLEGAINAFDLCLYGMTALDIGSSTGGFTDCMLQSGVIKVYAVDVGKGLIAWSLRNDERVNLIENKNARYFKETDIPEKIDLITIDVSFISIKKIVPAVIKALKQHGYILALIKPQFEAERAQISKNGVVKDIEVIQNILEDRKFFFESLGLEVRGQVRSPILGPAGNREYILWAVKL